MVNFKKQLKLRLITSVKALVMVVAICAILLPKNASAIPLLRDAETEWYLRMITDPILEAAGLEPEAVNLYIVNDNEINAFVAGGQNIFIHTGLLLKLENANQLIAVLAHETGHISGGHIARQSDGMTAPTSLMLVSVLLGVAAAVAGSPDAALGMVLGGQTMAQRTYLKYSRRQEASTDQAALRFLERTETSPIGLIETFRMFRGQEMLSFRYQDPYARSHPTSSDRIRHLQERVEASPFYDKPVNEAHQYWFKRIQGKLAGYLNPPKQTYYAYPEQDTSVEARYARVYAYHKDINWDKALNEGQKLIEQDPNDPYFQEIVAQIYLENGQVNESIPYYRRSNELLNDNPLIMISLAHALISSEKTEHVKEAVSILERVVTIEPENDFAWRQLGIAYTQSDMKEEASLATAELFALYGMFPESKHHANLALEYFPEGSPKWIRAQDIVIQNDINMEDGNRRNRRN